jgi:hypothetical protein
MASDFWVRFLFLFFFFLYISVFLYPPSQDSLIQVTEESFNSCNLKDPILYMNNGNSLFNITAHGEFYFTSGKQGNCEKKQKLHISVFSGNGSADSPSYGPSAFSPSYPTVFGSIPQPPSSLSLFFFFFFAFTKLPNLHRSSCWISGICCTHVKNIIIQNLVENDYFSPHLVLIFFVLHYWLI